MSRVQLSINVSDIDAAVAFYSRLLGAQPAKLRPGGTINHLGVEVGSTGEVTQAGTRLDTEGLEAEPEPGAVCCYALQDKVWAQDPDGVGREYYAVLEHMGTP